MAVVPQHLTRDMSGDVHDRFIAGSAFCQLSDERVASIVQPTLHARALTDVGPGGLEGREGSRWVKLVQLSKREEIPTVARFSRTSTCTIRGVPLGHGKAAD